MTDRIAYTALGVILGAVAYIVVGTLWMLNYAVQNILAGMA